MGEARDSFWQRITGSGLERQLHQAARRDVPIRNVRDPRAATQSVNAAASGLNKAMVPEWDADTAFRFAYYANIFVYRCVQITAQAIASMPFRAGADPDKPHDFNSKARLAQLLGPPPKGPAPKLSARKLWAWSVAQYLVTGRMAWELELGGQGFGNLDVVNLWPLVSSKFQAVPSQQGVEWFRAFNYNYGTQQPVPLRPEQVFYAWRPSAIDFRQPESVLQAARLDISVAVMQDRYDYAFLRNDARPASIVVHERFAERDAREAFREQFRGDFQGPDNAGKTLFLEAADADEEQPMDVRGSLHVETLGLSQKDAQFMQRYETKLRAICIAFGTPISKLGDASNRTFDNADAEDRNWWRDTVLPLAIELQDEVNLQLAPRLGSEVGWFDTSGVEALQPRPFWLPEPLTALVDVVITKQEARQAVGFPGELPEGQVLEPKPAPVIPLAPLAQPEPVTDPAVPKVPAPRRRLNVAR